MREQLTRLLRLCIGEEKGVLASGKGEGGECMLACFQGENCQGARDREEHKERERGGGGVEGLCLVTLLGGEKEGL